MGLHSPFGYVDYEVAFAELLITILDKLCAHCHTNQDYYNRCRGCPAGQLAFECRTYVLDAQEEDKHFELYTSEEWQARREKQYGHRDPPEEIESWRRMAEDYKPESEILRQMKKKVKELIPHPFFYVRHHRRYPYERPKSLEDFDMLVKEYRNMQKYRRYNRGLSI